MKSKILLIFLFIISIFIITGCRTNKTINEGKENNMNSTKITINNKVYDVALEDNETAQAFAKMLPQEFNMSELNGNEKYYYMATSLPTNPSTPKHIEAGDIMLYGNDCLVIFYKSFDTNYSYTKIGHIKNLPDLGNSDVSVKFE